MKFAICQELFENWEWVRQCRFAKQTGYDGLEVAPFTLASRITDVTPAKRTELKQQAADEGIDIIGLHWLLAKTTGFHLTTADAGIRKETQKYLRELAIACADLGGEVLVLGSPLQRNLEEGTSYEQALQRVVETFAPIMRVCADHNVYLCFEPLSPKETNFINTCEQGAELIAMINHPHFLLHQDVKAMLSEGTPLPELIHRYKHLTRHFHTNDSNLLGPGMGDTDFNPIFKALKETEYSHWVSVEVFDYSPGAENIAQISLQTMQQAWQRAQTSSC